MALRKIGVIFSAEGHAQYLGQLKQVNQEMRTLSTQSKLAVAQLGNNASITDTYGARMKSMTAQLDVARSRTTMLVDQQKILGDEQKRLPSMIDNATKSYNQSNATTKELRKSYQDLAKAKGEDAQETIEAEKAYKASNRETNALKKELKELEVVYNQNSKELEKLPNNIAKAELAQQRLTNSTQRLHEEYRNQGGVLADVAKGWQDFGDRVQNVGYTMTRTGDYLTTRVTLPILATGGLMVKASMDWESAWAGVMKTNDEVVDSTGNVIYGYEQLESELRGLATTTLPLTHTEIAGIAENAGQLGIAAQDVTEFTEVIGKLGHTTNLTYDEASTALAQFLNVTGSGTDTVSNLASSIVALGNNTAATEKDILMMSQRWATTGAMIGLTDDQITAISASLISMGVNVEAGGSALQRFGQKVNSHVLDAGESLDLLAETSGMTASEFATAWENEPVEAIQAFLLGLDGVVKEGGNANQLLKELGITSVNELNALLALAGGHEQLATAIGLSSDAYAENTALNDEFAVFAETTAAKVQVLKNRLTDIAIEFGGPIADALTSALDAAEPWIETLADIAEEFSNMDEAGQRNILMWIGIAAAAGPVLSIFGRLTSVSGKVITGVGKVIKTIGKLTTPKSILDMPGNIGKVTTELNKVPGSATTAGGAASLFSNPYVVASGVAIAAIAAVGAYLLYEANEPVRAHAESVKETEGAYQDWFDGVTAGIGIISELGETAIASAQDTTQAYKDALDEIQNANAETQNALSAMFGENVFGGNEYRFFEGEWLNQFRLRLDNVTRSMKDFGASEEEINRVQTAFNNYGTMLTNTQSEVFRLFEAEQVVTADWAIAQTQAIDGVTKAVVEGLEERRTVRQAELDAQLEGQYITQQVYDQEIQALNSYTDQAIASIQKSTQSISEIFAEASRNNRVLQEEDVASFVASMMNISKVTGESLSENQEVMNLLADNMSFLTQHTSVEAMKRMGILDDEAISALKNAKTTEEALQIMINALDAYGAKELEPKNAYVDGSQAEVELMDLTDLANEWNNLTLEEKRAQVESRGKEEIDELLELLGVDWESLTPSQKRYYAEAEGGEALENILYLTGEWNRQTDPEVKYAVLETQIDNEALLGAIEARDLWNNADFMSLAMEVDTNAPDAEAQLVNLVNYFSAQLGLHPLQMETEALTEESQQKLADLIATYTGADVGEVLEFLTETNAPETADEIEEFNEAVAGSSPEVTSTFHASAGEADVEAGKADEWNTTLGETPESKSSGIQTNIFSMALNTIAVLGYNVAVGAMTDKTSTLTTAVPGIVTNTLLVHGWNNAMANSYSKTSTLTTVHRTVRENAGFATGGHIDAYAEGGNIAWGGMFANGASNVPRDYVGIVGEAGPELFHVTDRGVSITPLNSREKMRGVTGAIEDYMKGKGGGGDTINLSVNIDQPVIREDNDLKELEQRFVKVIDKSLGQLGIYKRRGLSR
ncbi:phage tail tape measure protein [Ruoffia tabacinasalis]|uniref:Phage tail tape measure protein n=1 Tax=Ruoffia tabacinasalis TaxID=87458 RepID=A0A5R9EFP5_9LACT|nr:phage tail tape measure protein [Ruoffia tabacinasalis]TLQ49277.1 phage tail tape measure protein [Ruoffia tabacinasalis]